jgi:cytidylate kinase
MAIVTISDELGASGLEIGQGLAGELGYRCIDQELISEGAQRYGLLEAKLSHLGESKPSLFERFTTQTRHYILVTQATLLDLAAGDNVVLMGRGGQWLLRGIPHVLRVRVAAPFEVRTRRLAAKMPGGLVAGSPPPRAVTDSARRDDASKAGRMRYLYDVDIKDPALYDVVVNTTYFSVPAAISLLTHLLRGPAFAVTAAGRKLVADRALGAAVEVAIARRAPSRAVGLTVRAADGLVTIEGPVDAEEIEPIVRGVAGVKGVTVLPVAPPPIPPFVA